MKTTTREELLQVIGRIGEECPQIRLGQLVAQLSYMARELSIDAVGNVEDDELLEAARTHLKQLKKASGHANVDSLSTG